MDLIKIFEKKIFLLEMSCPIFILIIRINICNLLLRLIKKSFKPSVFSSTSVIWLFRLWRSVGLSKVCFFYDRMFHYFFSPLSNCITISWSFKVIEWSWWIWHWPKPRLGFFPRAKFLWNKLSTIQKFIIPKYYCILR